MKTRFFIFIVAGLSLTNLYAQPNLDWWVGYAPEVSLAAEHNLTKIDNNGNVYSVGYKEINVLINDFDTVLLKYDSLGNLLWQQTIGGDANASDAISDIEINSYGDIFVTGYIETVSGATDILVIKYNSDGEQQWVNVIDSGNGVDAAKEIAIDSQDNVYVTGQKTGSDGTVDIFVSKFTSLGTLLWTTDYSSDFGNSAIYQMDIDDLDNVYTTGFSAINSINGSIQVAIVQKYSSSGELLWTSQHGEDRTCSNSTGFEFAVDKISGEVYSLIWSCSDNETALGGDLVVKKINTNGQTIWIYINEAIASDVWGIKKDSDGNIAVVASSYSETGTQNYKVLKISSIGELIWQTDSNYTTASGARDMTIDAQNNVYVTGWVSNTDNSIQYINTAKFSSIGELLCEVNLIENESTNGMPMSITIDENNSTYIGGVYATNTNNIITLKYSNWDSCTLGINEYSNNNVLIFPNPTEGLIYFENINKNTSLKLINTLGQTIEFFNNFSNSNNIIDISKYPNGIYYLEIFCDGKVKTEKIIKS